MRLELATPTRLVVAEEVDEVVAPGSEGYFGVWPGHAPFLTTLGSGAVSYRRGREEQAVAVSGGFAEVGPERVIILAESAERARQRAEARLGGRAPRGGEEEIDYARAVAALSRALARLQVAGRPAR